MKRSAEVAGAVVLEVAEAVFLGAAVVVEERAFRREG